MDDETREFYEKNKDMVDRILRERENAGGDRDFRESYLRAVDAVDGLRDALTDFGRDQLSYADRRIASDSQALRYRMMMEEERARAHASFMYDRASEDLSRVRGRAEKDFDTVFGFVNDPSFQRHVVGAGLEMAAALSALIQSGPFPETLKETVRNADLSRSREFCRKNENCYSRSNPDRAQPAQEAPKSVKIPVVRKSDE